MTTMKVPVEVRDRLMALAQEHNRPLGAELAALLDDAEERKWWSAAKAASARLQADPDEWADYLKETEDWDAVSADGLGDSAGEWAEYTS